MKNCPISLKDDKSMFKFCQTPKNPYKIAQGVIFLPKVMNFCSNMVTLLIGGTPNAALNLGIFVFKIG